MPLLVLALAFVTGLALVFVQHVMHEHVTPASQAPALGGGRGEAAPDHPAP